MEEDKANKTNISLSNTIEPDENVYHCDFLICAGGKASPLLRLFSNLDEDTMVGSILIPGAVVPKANATLKASDPDSVSCNIHKVNR